jgi:hypothetical protein
MGLASIVAVLLLGRGIPAIHQFERQVRVRVERKALELDRAQSAVRALPDLERRTSSITRRVATLAPALLSGASATEAGLDLTMRLRALAREVGAVIEGDMVRADSLPGSAIPRVVVEMRLLTDPQGLLDLLHSLDRQDLVIVTLQVSASTLDGAPAEVEAIRVVLRASGRFLARSQS